MGIHIIVYLLFIHISLLIPGYVVAKQSRLFSKRPGLELCCGYLLTLFFFALLATTGYAFDISLGLLRLVSWLALLGSMAVFVVKQYYYEIWSLRFPLICFMAITVFSAAFMGLTFNSSYSIQPDPQPQANRNYHVLNVKVLNVAQTRANDNYIPYRQAQFMINRSDPAKDSFIGEWGVTFFQRTPLMGAVTATYFNMLHDKVPIDYTWSVQGADPDHTYLKFQVLAQILNALFILPAFFLLTKLFSKKIAAISCLFFISSQFFLYNAFFSWPKSLVAFFILLSWLLLLEKKIRYTIMAAVASGLAYLTHDLAVLYIGASIVLLLLNRRFRESVIFLGVCSIFALPWLLASTVLYHKPSSFILYPISTDGIPQPEQKQMLIHKFFHTSPLRLVFIRLENFVYLMSPYQIFTSEGGQNVSQRFWALGLFSIPGSLGIGLMLPAILGAVKRVKTGAIWILILFPVILETVVIGWPKGLGSLHFAEAIVVLLSGLGVAFLVKLKNKLWTLLAYAMNCSQTVLFIGYSYKFNVHAWLTHASDILALLCMAAIIGTAGWLVYRISHDKKIWIAPA